MRMIRIAPAPSTDEGGLTERERQLLDEGVAAVMGHVGGLPVDLVRQLEGWRAREGHPNVMKLTKDQDGLRALRAIQAEVAARVEEHRTRTDKVRRLAQEVMPDSTAAWAHLQACAVKGDGLLLSPAEEGAWRPEEMTNAQCIVFAYLVMACSSLDLFWMAHDDGGENVKLGVGASVESKLRPLGNATELKRRAKEAALAHELGLSPKSKADVLAEPILVALLLPLADAAAS